MSTVITVGDHPVQLANGHTIRIDQPLTRDECVRIERALTEVNDPHAHTVHTIELHPIIGETATATVHRWQRFNDEIVTTITEVRA